MKTSKYLLDELEADWRPLYRVAWADFHRFMKGWSPGHWKLSDYSERVTRAGHRILSQYDVLLADLRGLTECAMDMLPWLPER